jgi:hypothetical protein
MNWEQTKLKAAIKSARRKFGPVGWTALGPRIRHAFIKAEVPSIISSAASFEDSPQGQLATLTMQLDPTES